MITVFENDMGERAVVYGLASFNRIAQSGWDVIASRFVGARVAYSIPATDQAGLNAALRMAIDSLGAVYPQCNCSRLAVVMPSGEIVATGNKIVLANRTGTARRTIVTALTRQRQIPIHGGYVVHL